MWHAHDIHGLRPGRAVFKLYYRRGLNVDGVGEVFDLVGLDVLKGQLLQICRIHAGDFSH